MNVKEDALKKAPEDKSPFVSVVMPVYNAERYLPAALASVREQAFSSWELCLVNDASTDGSGALCDAAAQADARVRVIHFEKNQGASAARNAGMDIACGEYVMFLDADDEMDRDLLARLYALARADVTVWGVWDEYLDIHERIYKRVAHIPRSGFFRGKDAVRGALIDLEADTLLGYTWNKLYNREMLKKSGARYENRLVTEDIFFNLSQCACWESLCQLDMPALHYKHREAHTSITGRFVPDYFEQNRARVEAILALYDAWGRTDAHVLTVLGNIYARYVFAALERLFDPRAGADGAERRAFLRARFSKTEDPLFARVIPCAAPSGLLARVMARALKMRCAALCLLIAKSARFARDKLPALFTRLRQSR